MRQLIKYGLEKSSEPIIIISNHLDKRKKPKVAYANKKYLEIVDKPISKIVGKKFYEILNIEESNYFYKDLIESLKESKRWSGPLVLGPERNNIRYFDISAIRDIDNKVSYYIVAGRTQECESSVDEDENTKVLEDIVDNIFSKYNFIKEFSSNTAASLWEINNRGDIVYLNEIIKKDFPFKEETNLTEYLTEDSINGFYESLDSFPPAKKINTIRLELKDKNNTVICCKYWPIYKESIIVGFGGAITDKTHEKDIVKQLTILKNN